MKKSTAVLLNFAHLLDHHFLLIAAACVGLIAKDMGLASWTDMMPYTAGAFLMFGLGSIPAGRLGDLWGRRRMMVIFFFGMGASGLLVAATQTPIQFGVAMAILGAFSAIYHPVGIPMLLATTKAPGRTIGISGLAGNLGLATAALLTALIVSYSNWRYAFVIPSMVSLIAGALFVWSAESEGITPAKRKAVLNHVPIQVAQQALIVITIASTTGSLLFNLSTNSNGELLFEKLGGLISSPLHAGYLVGGLTLVASLTQLMVGQMIDRVPTKPLFRTIIAAQVLAFVLAWATSGWWFCAALLLYMVSIFAAIPFSDTLIARFIDDSMRSRVSGIRLAISFGVSSLTVIMLGPLVKALGFNTMLLLMAGVACVTLISLQWLPETRVAPKSSV